MNICRTTLMALMFAAFSLGTPLRAITQQEFIDMCQDADTEQIAEALKDTKLSVTAADPKGNTALMMAVQGRGKSADPQKVRLLIDAGSNVNAQNKDTMRVLMLAAQRSDDPAVLAELVHAGAELEERSSRGWTALSFAAARNPDPIIANVLIDLGADINATENAEATPLALALRAGNTYAVVDALLNDGAALTAPNAKKPQTQEPDPKKYTEEQLADLKERLKKEPQIAAASPERFALACRYGTPQRITLLLQARTDPNAPYDGQTPLMNAAQYNVHPGVITTLLQWGAHEDDRDENGRTALICAAGSKRNPGALTELLTSGARADCRDISGKNALDYAQENPVYTAGDLRLLSSIILTVEDAERRGAEMELERQKAEQLAATDARQLTELYRRIAQNQNEILRLTEDAATLRKQLDRALSDADAAQQLEQRGQLQLSEQKSLVEKLTGERQTFQDEQEKDRASLRSVTDKLTSLWQTELQKNLSLVRESSLEARKNENEIGQLTEELRKLREEAAQFAQVQSENETRHRNELNDVRAQAESERAALEAAQKNKIDELQREIERGQEEKQQTQILQNSADSQHRQEILSLKAQQSRLLEDAALKSQQYVAELNARHAAELSELRSQAERRHIEELQKLDAQWQEKKTAEITALRAELAIELTERRTALEEEYGARFAEESRKKDSETRQKLEAAETENFKLKAQFDETLTTMREAIGRAVDSAAAREAEIEAQKNTLAAEKAELERKLAEAPKLAEAELQKQLGIKEAQLRAEFEVEKARIEATHRQELLSTAAALEANYVEELNNVKKLHQEELEKQLSQLRAELDSAVEQAIQDRERAEKAEAQRAAEDDGKKSDDYNAGVEQGHGEARRILETAYTTSLRQTQTRYDRMLKEQQTQLRMEQSAALDALNTKHRQELQKLTLEGEQQRQTLLSEQQREHEAQIAELQKEWSARSAAREQELLSRHETAVRRLNDEGAKERERLAAALKQEYTQQLERFIALQSSLRAAETKKAALPAPENSQ